MPPIPVDPSWWQHLFDETYLVTDARSVCNPQLTRREVDFLEIHLGLGKDERILDLCGGHGRHSLELARRGYRAPTVLDYSGYLVNLGRSLAARDGLRVRFIRADARQTGLTSRSFDCILVMANSFGYFPDDRDNLQILCEAHRLCRPGGRLLLDLLDSRYVSESFRPSSEHRVSRDVTVHRERELVDGLVRVRERVYSEQRGLIREATYCERLFTEEELRRLLHRAGFGSVRILDDFSSHGTPGDYGFMTRRVIVTAVRS